jgi:hypothetical protein
MMILFAVYFLISCGASLAALNTAEDQTGSAAFALVASIITLVLWPAFLSYRLFYKIFDGWECE